MPRPKGSKNKKTIEREAALRLAQDKGGVQTALIPAVPFSEEEVRGQISEVSPAAETAASTSGRAFIEYSSPGGDRWRVENGQQLLAAFSMESDELKPWHEAMAPEKAAWHILRMFFGIAPLMGETTSEYLVPRGLESIAEPLGLNPANVQAQIDAAKQYWTRWRMANKAKLEPPPSIVSTPAIPTDEVEALLNRYGFQELEGANERQFAAQRLRDFKHKLEDEEGGTLPTQVIRLELQMAGIDKINSRLSKTAATSATDRDELARWLKMYDGLSERWLKAMEALNATQAQNPSAQRKVAFIDCLGTLVKGIQDYEARGDTALIDGIHTAGEIKFLVTPTSLRPAQYRPDLIAILTDALKHHNLWDPEYVHPSLPRATHRRLLKAVKDGLEAAARTDGEMPDMEDDETSTPVQTYEQDRGGQSADGGAVGPVLNNAGAVAGTALVRPKRKAAEEFLVS